MSRHNPFRKYTSTAGLSIAAGMLMSGCGGGGGGGGGGETPPVQPDQNQPAPPAIVQPAWGSMGMLVAPGQASKTINLTNCSSPSIQEISNASVTITAGGDVSFRAATTAGGTVSELVAMPLAASTRRSLFLDARDGNLSAAEYSYAQAETSTGISLNSGEGVSIRISSVQGVICASPPLSDLTPAITPSEQRTASAFLAGVNAADPNQANSPRFARLINGIFSWANPSLIVTGAANGQTTANTIQISNGHVFKGVLNATNDGLASTNPAPVRVTYSAALLAGRYVERFTAADGNNPTERLVELRISNPNARQDILQLRRIGDALSAEIVQNFL